MHNCSVDFFLFREQFALMFKCLNMIHKIECSWCVLPWQIGMDECYVQYHSVIPWGMLCGCIVNIMYNTSNMSCDVICWKISWYEYNVSHKYYGLGWQCWKIPNKTAILGFMLKIQNNSNCFNYIFCHCHRFQFITRGTLWIPTVQQELPTVPEHLNSIPFLSGFVLITL